MKILVCDDNDVFAAWLAEQLHRFAAEWGLPIQLMCVTKPSTLTDKVLAGTDIAFLDVDMGEVNGIDLAHRLRSIRPDAILLFVTNYIEYAPSGYEVQALRYLVKSQCAEKLSCYFRLACDEYAKLRQTFTIHIGAEKIDIPLSHILYLETQQRQLLLHLQNDRQTCYQFYATMASVADRLEPLGFLRIHKSYLVNIAQIKKLQYESVTLKNGRQLPMGESRYNECKSRYLMWKG